MIAWLVGDVARRDRVVTGGLVVRYKDGAWHVLTRRRPERTSNLRWLPLLHKHDARFSLQQEAIDFAVRRGREDRVGVTWSDRDGRLMGRIAPTGSFALLHLGWRRPRQPLVPAPREKQ